jgi:hypothetical protein
MAAAAHSIQTQHSQYSMLRIFFLSSPFIFMVRSTSCPVYKLTSLIRPVLLVNAAACGGASTCHQHSDSSRNRQ